MKCNLMFFFFKGLHENFQQLRASLPLASSPRVKDLFTGEPLLFPLLLKENEGHFTSKFKQITKGTRKPVSTLWKFLARETD